MADQEIRVLRIINRFNLGGPTFNAAYLTKYLEKPFVTRLVGGTKDESEASSTFILDQLELPAETLGTMRRAIGIGDVSAYREVRKIIDEFKPHIVHTHASKAGSIGRLAAIHADVPVIVHTFHGHVFHSYFGSFKTAVFKGIERYLASKSDRIIAISNRQKDELVNEHAIAPASKVAVVPLGFDLDRFRSQREEKRAAFRQEYGLSDSEVAIVIVGRLVPVKNHSLFIDMAARLKESGYHHVRYFIVGDGESREELESHLKMRGLGFTQNTAPNAESPVCLTSWITDVDRVYAGCDIVCLTSLNEGTPVSLIEAQAAAKPILSTDVGGIRDVVDEGQSALLSVSGDLESLLANAKQLIDAPERCHALGKHGDEITRDRFSYQRLVNDIRNLYTTLLHQKGLISETDL